MWRQFSFWRRSAAVSAASLDGVSPFEARRGGALRLACCRHPAGGKGAIAQLLADHPHDYALPARRWQHAKHVRQGRPGELAGGTPGIYLAPKERRWERGVYGASMHDCQQATDCSNALLLATLKRRERRAPLNTYDVCATSE
jgi:hypothetical protein